MSAGSGRFKTLLLDLSRHLHDRLLPLLRSMVYLSMYHHDMATNEEVPQEVAGTGRYRAECLQHEPRWYGPWQDTYGAAQREVQQHNETSKHHALVMGEYSLPALRLG
jgi:hypothetical protein